jgi:hypothetical protein
MATISQIFSHSKVNNQTQQNPNNNSHRKYPIHLEKETSTYKENQSKVIKTPRRLKGERNTTTPSSMQCMTIQRCLHQNFVKAISSTYDENSTYQQK